MNRKRELQKLANARGYSLRTGRPTKNARGHWLRRVRAGLEGDVYLYEVREGLWAREVCRNLDDAERIIRRKKSIHQSMRDAFAEAGLH